MKNFLDILPTIESDKRNLVILDDQMSEPGKLQETSNIFTKGSHHRNITLASIVQNVFAQVKVHRTISLNSHSMVLFKNPPDEGQMRSINLHVFRTKVKFFMDCFREPIKKDHWYLHLDLHPLTPHPVRVRCSLASSTTGLSLGPIPP